MADSPWEYVQDTCDVWQVAQLCNRMAGDGWEPVTVFEGWPGMKVPDKAGSDDGPTYAALRPYTVLFRRHTPTGEPELP